VHQLWSKELLDGPVGKSLRKRLDSYTGTNQRVMGWQREIEMLAGDKGPALLGEQIIKEVRSIKEEAARWGFFEDSAFIRQAVSAATDRCREQITAGSLLTMFLTDQLLRWNGWEQRAFKEQFSNCVLSPHAANFEELRNGLKRLALDKIGDPRLPLNAGRWVGMQKAAHNEFLKWLSHDDITFFFEHVLPRGSDPHRRKNFWLRYVGRVKRSRPLLFPGDENRLHSLERRSDQKVGHYGRIEGLTSAFLLDFDELLVVEFSVVGNACYVYDRKGAAKLGTDTDFWRPAAFSVPGLKRQRIAVDHIAHHPVWRENMSRLLARYGIYPGA
jgi:hypothetical protein